MIDFTPAQSRAYSEHIEQPGVSQDEIDHKAIQIMRGLSDLDIADALMGSASEIRNLAASEGRTYTLGHVVRGALHRYCHDIAKRVLEA